MKRRIVLSPSCFAPDVILEIDVPEDRDAEEYIDELLEAVLADEFRWNCEWDFE